MTKLGIGLAGAVVAAALWLALGSREVTTAGPAEELAAVDEPPPVSKVAEISVVEAPSEERTALTPARAADEANAPPPASPLLATALGHVLDVEGRPLAGVEIAVHPPLEPAPARLVSDADGRFELPRPAGYMLRTVTARLPGHVAVLLGELQPSTAELHVVLAPAIALGGSVVDEAGGPVSGVTVALRLGPAFGSRLDVALEHSREQSWLAPTDERGRFRFEAAPAVRGAHLSVEGAIQPAAVLAPQVPADDLRLVVVGPQPAGILRGRVVDPSGAPIAGAWVAAGDAGARSGEDGGFELDREAIGDAARIHAAAEGQLPAVLDARTDAGGEVRWPEPLVLRLGGPPLEISGRLLDDEGDPLARRGVWLCDPTLFGPVGEWKERAALESLLAGSSDEPYCVTDDGGRFRMTGLLPREYTLQAEDPGTLRVARREAVTAGSQGVVLRFAPLDAPVAIAGRCVDLRSEPIAGVELSASRLVRSWEGSTFRISGANVSTDADGRFRLAGLPPEVDRLRFDGQHVLPGERELEVGGAREALVLVVPLRCHLQVEASARFADATSFQVLDEAGELLALHEFRGRSASSSTAGSLREGRSNVLAVSDAATTVVLLARDEELARRELELMPGEPLLVRFD